MKEMKMLNFEFKFRRISRRNIRFGDWFKKVFDEYIMITSGDARLRRLYLEHCS